VSSSSWSKLPKSQLGVRATAFTPRRARDHGRIHQ
jgi:hypothetical protein